MVAATTLLADGPALLAEPAPSTVIADIDLGNAFGARSTWRFVASQEERTNDPSLAMDYSVTTVRFCLSKAGSNACVNGLQASPAGGDWGARYLDVAKVVHPRGASAPPLLLLRTASNGAISQGIYTQILAYRRAEDTFVQVYGQVAGRNNNGEIRFIASGPLAGDVISAEATSNRPYAYWITVNRLTPDYTYKQVLRYRSVTGYADGNGLAVIDSEMPSIQKRLGLWRSGSPIPTPSGSCPKPRLVRMELWCN